MDGIPAAFADDIDHAGLAELGRHAIGLQTELLNSVQVRNDINALIEERKIVHAVLQECCGGGALSRCHDLFVRRPEIRPCAAGPV